MGAKRTRSCDGVVGRLMTALPSLPRGTPAQLRVRFINWFDIGFISATAGYQSRRGGSFDPHSLPEGVFGCQAGWDTDWLANPLAPSALSYTMTEAVESEGVAYARLRERGKTVRFCVAFPCVMLLLAWFAWLVYKSHEQPWWLTLIMYLVPSGIFGVPFFLLVRCFRGKIAEWSVRNEKLEKLIDPNRTSSELDSHGRHEHD